jgi:hypothetical protein
LESFQHGCDYLFRNLLLAKATVEEEAKKRFISPWLDPLEIIASSKYQTRDNPGDKFSNSSELNYKVVIGFLILSATLLAVQNMIDATLSIVAVHLVGSVTCLPMMSILAMSATNELLTVSLEM